MQIWINKPQISKFTQKHAQIAFYSKYNSTRSIQFRKQAARKTKACKNEATEKQNKPEKKQPASLQNNLQVQEKICSNSWENRKVGNTDTDLATAGGFHLYGLLKRRNATIPVNGPRCLREEIFPIITRQTDN